MANDLVFTNDFSKSTIQYLTTDQLSKFRFINLTEPSNKGVSKRYVFSPTDLIINALANLGWGVIEVKEQAHKDLSRTGRTESTSSFHMVVMQNNSCAIVDEDGTVDAYPRIILTTSHDGRHAVRMYIGLYRCICSNGLVVADLELGNGRVCHKGEDAKNIISLVTELVTLAEKQVHLINKLRSLKMTEEEQIEFAFDCLVAVKGSRYDYLAKEDYESLLDARRDEDEGNSMWLIFNRIQENLVKGGYMLPSLGKKKGLGKPRIQRPIKGAESELNANIALWNTMMDWAKRVETRIMAESQPIAPEPKLLRDKNGRFIKKVKPIDIQVVEVIG